MPQNFIPCVICAHARQQQWETKEAAPATAFFSKCLRPTSLRDCYRASAHRYEFSAVVVEAAPCTFTDIPNDAVEAIHGLLAGSPQDSERLAVVPLDKLRPSPFYNMLADGKPVEKALTLLHFTQRRNGKQHAHGLRIVTERAQDATAGDATELTIKN